MLNAAGFCQKRQQMRPVHTLQLALGELLQVPVLQSCPVEINSNISGTLKLSSSVKTSLLLFLV